MLIVYGRCGRKNKRKLFIYYTDRYTAYPARLLALCMYTLNTQYIVYDRNNMYDYINLFISHLKIKNIVKIYNYIII